MSSLKQRTVFITGASRGIGRAIALACAREGANVVIAAKSAEPHPKLPGTIYSVAEEVEQAGGQALPLLLDVREETAVVAAMHKAGEHFGGIDMLVNNAGAIQLQGVEHLPVKRYDLLQQINSRAVFVCSQAALPWLKKSPQAHILSLSPPINLEPRWFGQYGPYTLSKYGMSLLSIGMAVEFRRYGIRVNTLWPQTLIATAAVEMQGGAQALKQARTPAIMADAALRILQQQDPAFSGRHLIDESWLREQGQLDFEHYRHQLGDLPLMNDLFVD